MFSAVREKSMQPRTLSAWKRIHPFFLMSNPVM
jgi:hypothetical protein